MNDMICIARRSGSWLSSRSAWGLRRGPGLQPRAVLALLGCVLLTAAGCSAPTGTDGLLPDDWPALPAATVFTPAAGVCHAQAFSENNAAPDDVVDCSTPHRT